MMFTRALSFVLVHFCTTADLARLDRVIFHEVQRRGDWKKERPLADLTPGADRKVRRVMRHLDRTLSKWG